MRLAVAIVLSTALAVPAVATATGAPGLAAPKVTDFSSAEKKKKKTTTAPKKNEDNMKAAPSDPQKGQSTY